MKKRIVTVGTFDGVHRGHRAVLQYLKQLAAEHGLEPLAITFRCHPLALIAPGRMPSMIETPQCRRYEIEKEGVECEMLEFDDSLRNLTARQWLERLRAIYGAEMVVIGYDNTFGSDCRSLRHEDYIRIGKEIGLEVVTAPEVAGVSSSAIRKSVAEGDLERASQMLGHPFRIEGVVVHGDAIGRSIGVPTANIDLQPAQLLPPSGVYAATAILNDGSRHAAALNIGTRPTLADRDVSHALRVEAFLPDFDGDLYGATIVVEIDRKIRDEKKFDSLEALKNQIDKDVCIIHNS